ncbi:MAG: D-alanyl-D-alanine carboxypeptidase/D-alanyl-D-alanine-endopeptidase [Epsilonproteobacteria bacterium]|nr:D-alanyl-D-alanine carboxypeptidase/D-alanyl-D-alanine-endopeptidase [Campylobacterota bacterium]
MRILFLYLIASLWLFALPASINQIITKSGISKRDISIYIKETGAGGKVVASLNANKTRTPASIIKVLSTYAAVLKLGFNYRWQTKFYTTGTLSQGILRGDLLIKGFGDPTLNGEDLEKIISYIKAEGIRKIKGDIVIDRSYFKVGNRDSSGFDEHPYSAYNAMPDAMMFNERVITVCVEPKKNSVYKKHADGSYKVINRLQRVNKPCRGRYSWPGVKVDKSDVMPKVILKGKISKRCGKRNVCKVLTKPYKSFYYALKDGLKQEGISVAGRLKLRKIPADATELFTYYSDSLEKIISKTAKKSNNLYARHLLLLLGAKVYGAPATLQKGRDAIIKVLSSKGALGTGVLRLDNGSGLSRVAKLNAKLLSTMLDHAYDRYGQRWMNTLSIAGVDGTIKRRFRGTVVRNRAWMKTGTLRRVKNIAGYVKNRAGKRYTVVILVNSTKAKYRGAKLQNEIIKWLVQGAAKPSPKSKTKLIVASKTKKIHKSVKHKTVKQKRVKQKIHTKVAKRKYYYVQVGSFKLKPSKTYTKKISRLGLPYTVKKSGIYKVLIGPYKKESTARKVLRKVKEKLNRSAFITKR